ncbi:hypothetical protein [Haliangium sp.]|uniref:hypothetical protein n=1 Tax=Haliangium sp. TaxID=2663208 RepID=UPI003D128958
MTVRGQPPSRGRSAGALGRRAVVRPLRVVARWARRWADAQLGPARDGGASEPTEASADPTAAATSADARAAAGARPPGMPESTHGPKSPRPAWATASSPTPGVPPPPTHWIEKVRAGAPELLAGLSLSEPAPTEADADWGDHAVHLDDDSSPGAAEAGSAHGPAPTETTASAPHRARVASDRAERDHEAWLQRQELRLRRLAARLGERLVALAPEPKQGRVTAAPAPTVQDAPATGIQGPPPAGSDAPPAGSTAGHDESTPPATYEPRARRNGAEADRDDEPARVHAAKPPPAQAPPRAPASPQISARAEAWPPAGASEPGLSSRPPAAVPGQTSHLASDRDLAPIPALGPLPPTSTHERAEVAQAAERARPPSARPTRGQPTRGRIELPASPAARAELDDDRPRRLTPVDRALSWTTPNPDAHTLGTDAGRHQRPPDPGRAHLDDALAPPAPRARPPQPWPSEPPAENAAWPPTPSADAGAPATLRAGREPSGPWTERAPAELDPFAPELTPAPTIAPELDSSHDPQQLWAWTAPPEPPAPPPEFAPAPPPRRAWPSLPDQDRSVHTQAQAHAVASRWPALGPSPLVAAAPPQQTAARERDRAARQDRLAREQRGEA